MWAASLFEPKLMSQYATEGTIIRRERGKDNKYIGLNIHSTGRGFQAWVWHRTTHPRSDQLSIPVEKNLTQPTTDHLRSPSPISQLGFSSVIHLDTISFRHPTCAVRATLQSGNFRSARKWQPRHFPLHPDTLLADDVKQESAVPFLPEDFIPWYGPGLSHPRRTSDAIRGLVPRACRNPAPPHSCGQDQSQ